MSSLQSRWSLKSLSRDVLYGLFFDSIEHWHVIENATDKLRSFLTNGGDANSIHHTGYSLLALACALNRTDAVQSLLDARVDVNVRLSICEQLNNWGPVGGFEMQFAVLIAAEFSDARVASLLIGANADLSARDAVNNSVCHRAALNEDPQVLRAFIAAGAAPHLSNHSSFFPVNLAVSNECETFLEVLIEAGVQLNIINVHSRSLLHDAAKNRNPLVLRRLLAAARASGIESRCYRKRTPCHYAASNENDAVISALLAAGCDGNACDERKITPAFLAAENPNELVLAALLDAGVSVDVRNREKQTLCHLAAKNCNHRVLALLLNANANPHCADDYDAKPIYMALSNPNSKVLDLLLEAGATLTPADLASPSQSVCHWAAANPNVDVLKRVLPFGVDVNQRDWEGASPLHRAAEGSGAESVALLLEAGADLLAVNNISEGVCHFAAKNTNVDVMSTLIARGADFNAADGTHSTPGHVATRAGNVGVLTILLDAGADIGAVDRDGNSLCHIAARVDDNGAVLRLLLARGANCHVTDHEGRTPCHSATEAALTELFAAGASLTAVDHERATPLRLASGIGGLSDARVLTLLAVGTNVRLADSNGITPMSSAVVRGQHRSALFVAVGASIVPPLPPKLVVWASGTIAHRQFKLMRARAFVVCVALQQLQLPALLSCAILENVFAPMESMVPFHRLWKIVTTVKHFERTAA
jgi:ankyrin repeat protein